MITCLVTYTIDPGQISAFERFAQRWIALVDNSGGQHHGYFLPSEGASDRAYALFTFPSLAAYEKYRARFGVDPDFNDADHIRDESGCVLRYERTFLRPIFDGDPAAQLRFRLAPGWYSVLSIRDRSPRRRSTPSGLFDALFQAKRSSRSTTARAGSGEIALVDDSSPLQRSGVLFYDTLLDESAAPYIAWGGGIPDGHLDYDPQRPEPLADLPINRSTTHVDFMIGGPDLTITGIRSDGSRPVILEGQHWAL